MLPPKAISVTQAGEPDGWSPPRTWRAEVAPDGQTRLVVSVPLEDLAATHLRLVRALQGPLGVLYVRLTDRAGEGQLPKPVRRVAMEIPAARVEAALAERAALVWHDARHQLWIKGRHGEQVVLDELGVLYAYPDDPSFRDALAGIPESPTQTMDARDYVRVAFLAEADEMERSLWAELNMVEWA